MCDLEAVTDQRVRFVQSQQADVTAQRAPSHPDFCF